MFQSYHVRHIALTIAGIKSDLGEELHLLVVNEFVDTLAVNTPRFDETKFRKQCHVEIAPGAGLHVVLPRSNEEVLQEYQEQHKGIFDG
jgi:hypothetical protein